jgi:hypothetical protein
MVEKKVGKIIAIWSSAGEVPADRMINKWVEQVVVDFFKRRNGQDLYCEVGCLAQVNALRLLVKAGKISKDNLVFRFYKMELTVTDTGWLCGPRG